MQNPAGDIKRLAIERPPRVPAFREGDLQKLFSSEDKIFVAYLKLIYYTFMRRSEGVSLAWEDIDFGRKVVYVRKTKSRRPRTIALAKGAIEVLRSLPVPRNPQQKIFPWREHSVTQKFRRLRKKLGIRIDGIHHFRHLCASELLRLGENIKVVQRLLDHTSAQTTLRIYSHVSLEDERQAVEHLPRV